MEGKRNEQDQAGVNRRTFIGALGAAAVAGALGPAAEGQAPPPAVHNYLDSFGNIVPCASDTIAAGVFPPPIPPNAVNPGAHARPKRHWLFGSRSHNATQPANLAPRASGSCIYNQPNCGTTAPSAGYPHFNVLMIIVDQMRAPRWLPSKGVTGALSGQAAIDAILTNIAAIRNQSFVFTNYNVAATSCSPARATLLTGLYSQQTCMFVSQDPPDPLKPSTPQIYAPPLQPWKGGQGFATIGDVLSQTGNAATGAPALNYDCVWIGKWHLSDNPGETSGTGANGPSDYGFCATEAYCIPTPPTVTSGPWVATGPYPSSTGDSNEGNSAYFLGNAQTGPPALAVPPDLPAYTNSPPFLGTAPNELPTAAPYGVVNDAAVAEAFGIWITEHAPTNGRWFAGVSFMNPHDINAFPYSFGLTATQCTGADLCYPNGGVSPAGQYGFNAPPPMLTSAQLVPNQNLSDSSESTTIAAFPGNPAGTTTQLYSESALPLSLNPGLYDPSSPYYNPNFPAGYNPSWNYPDQPTAYAGKGKPDLQSNFQALQNSISGEVTDENGWCTFLNYYFWMQACVDFQIGAVLQKLRGAQGGAFSDNTVIIFTADHGEFGGSHSLHSKGGALYEEALNVPLYIGFPGQANMVPRSFVCSSVDILPLLYTLALGNDSWRSNGCDIINYLNGREAVMDAIMVGTQNAPQRRLSSFPLQNPQGSAPWQRYQPYVLHTTDEYYSLAYLWPNIIFGPHAAAFRTFDNTLNGNTSGSNSLQRELGPAGGGKLGMYSYWNEEVSPGCSENQNPTQPVVNSSSYPQQFEFYNYQPAPNTLGNGGSSLAVNLAETGNDYWLANATSPAAIASQYRSAYQAASSPYETELTTVYAATACAYNAALEAWLSYISGRICESD
jgi:arylsulfatase A-like enzyme